ncbi:MAG: aminotransferase class V-fold PLP-dependent enzyme [Gammaproteobacteria bacterium]|nr:aminotransferase class V-fold PLP-dependent enzyme [Gammaproteobacteria bacterium]MCF6230297.1 aminotransferase class V-fold PLP-dependent enzyme [Gammaproteobacteria bacterium]
MLTPDIIAKEFPIEDSLDYLNHAAIAPWPRRSAEAITRFTEQNLTRGATDYLEWLKVENRLRGQLKTLIHAEGLDEIALLKNTSEALSVIAYGLEWQQGDNIVSSDQEFPSNRIVWQSLKNQGVELRKANLEPSDSPEQALIDQCDRKTQLLTVSSVQYASGIKLNLKMIGDYCHANGVLFCVDAIQSLGAHPFDVQAINADFVMADGHKWMFGPEGLALFYCRREHINTLKLNQYGWHMVEAVGEYNQERWQPAKSARRFECGSPNMLAIHALDASLSLLLEVGMENVEKLIAERVNQMLDLIKQRPQLTLISPSDPQHRSGIITFRHQKIDSEHLYQSLMNRGVICAARGGGIRFSPHFYTSQKSIDRAFLRLDNCIQQTHF